MSSCYQPDQNTIQYNKTLFQHGKNLSTLIMIKKIITIDFQVCCVGVTLHITIIMKTLLIFFDIHTTVNLTFAGNLQLAT